MSAHPSRRSSTSEAESSPFTGVKMPDHDHEDMGKRRTSFVFLFLELRERKRLLQKPRFFVSLSTSMAAHCEAGGGEETVVVGYRWKLVLRYWRRCKSVLTMH